MRVSTLFAVFGFLATALTACGGGGSDSGAPTNTNPKQIAEISVPTLTGFDLGTVDSAAGKYYLASAGNSAIDVFSSSTNAYIGQLAAGSFAGDHTTGFDRSHNGPNGVVLLPGTSLLYAGDVNSVKVVDTGTKAVVNSIAVSTSGLRADEGCYDPDDGIMMFSSPEESPPFATFILTRNQTIIAKYVFSPDTAGLEQCVYDRVTKSFLVNNDGTTAHPDGEVDVFPASSVVAGLPVLTKSYALDGCGPGGLALGPGNDMIVGCNPSPPSPQISLILDRTSGSVLAKVPFGGEDAVAYDPVSNRYFLAAFFHQPSGNAGNPATASSSLGVVDAGSRTLLTQLPTGTAAHGVSVDSSAHKVFVPHLAGTSGSAFATPGVTVFSTD